MACVANSLNTKILISNHQRDRSSSIPELVEKARKYSPVLVKGYHYGNQSVVDEKSWLEVCDSKHRYGGNLRVYYKEWKRLNFPNQDFWRWLEEDSIELPEVPRHKLEKETVMYCESASERKQFALEIQKNLLYHKLTGKVVNTGEEGWIFVLRDDILYSSKKDRESIPRIHHTTLVGGECVQAAGMLVVKNGVLKKIYPHSGHYRPSEYELRIFLNFLESHGLDLFKVQVDIQRVQKISREDEEGQIVKKSQTAQFWPASLVLLFLNTKALMWNCHLFDELIQVVESRKYVKNPKDQS